MRGLSEEDLPPGTAAHEPHLVKRSTAEDIENAAAIIQRCARKFLENHLRVNRRNLLLRLELEKTMMHGLRLGLLYLLLFTFMLVTAFVEQGGDPHMELGLLQSYTRMFQLEELEDIRTVSDMTDWLKRTSAASREAQVTSSQYFLEDAEQRLLSGVNVLQEAILVSNTGLNGELMINGFTFTAWINPPGSGVENSDNNDADSEKRVLVRRPLTSGTSTAGTAVMSCWSWAMQGEAVILEYGAHDHPRVQTTQEVIHLGTVGGLTSRATFLVLVIEGDIRAHTVVLYVNGNEFMRRALPRPLTDCAGQVLQLGDANVRLADLTFYPRALSTAEVADVHAFGLPIKSIVRGKASAQAVKDSTDTILELESQTLTSVQQGQAQILAEKSREEMLTRLSSCSATLPPIEMPTFQQQPRGQYATTDMLDWSGYQCPNLPADADLAVHGLPVGQQDVHRDPILDVNYLDIFPGRYGNFTDGGRFLMTDMPMHLTSLCMPLNYSLSMWVQPDVEHQLISTFLMLFSLDEGSCFELAWLQSTRSVLWYHNVDDRNLDETYWTFAQDWGEYGLGGSDGMLRHLVMVQEATYLPSGEMTFTWKIYLDGGLARTDVGGENTRTNCNLLIFPGTIGDPQVGVPSNSGYKGDMQQWRLYAEALSAEQIEVLHNSSVDPDTGKELRECLGFFSDWDVSDTADTVDAAGNDCSWYYEAKTQFPELCVAPHVRERCPIACGVRNACYTEFYSDEDSMFYYQMSKFAVADATTVTTCHAQQALDERDAGNGTKCCENSTSCVPDCNFDAPWRYNFSYGLKKSDGWTIAAWVRLVGSETEPRALSFFYFTGGDCSQKKNLMRIYIEPETEKLEVVVMIPSADPATVYKSASTYIESGTFSTTEWTLISVAVSPIEIPTDTSLAVPKRNFYLMVNSRSVTFVTGEPASQLTKTYAEEPEISLMDGFEIEGSMLLGPTEFLIAPLAPWSLQDYYYRYRSVLGTRGGPRTAVNATNGVQYQVRGYRAPAILLAPPLLLQSRHLSGSKCLTTAGTQAFRNFRELLTRQCSTAPYSCPNSVGGSAVYSCRSDEEAFYHFGRNAIDVDSMALKAFGEFLVTQESTVVARADGVYATSNFLDVQSKFVRLIMVVVAPDYNGRVSTITVDFDVQARVEASFEIAHFRAMQEESYQETKYYSCQMVVFMLALLLLLDGIFRMCWSWKRGTRRWPKRIVLFDIIFSLMVMAEHVMQVDGTSRASEQLVNHLNVLMTEDRWATDDPLEMKVSNFVADVDQLGSDIAWQANVRLSAMILAGITLFRFIIATQTHPRIAILMDTLSRGFDALVHYFLLLAAIFLGLVAIGILFFGGRHEEFASWGDAIELLTTIMLRGEFPEGTLKQPIGYIFFMLAAILTFYFLMLNFVLAIVVDMFAKVQQSLDDLEVEQFVFLDVWNTVHAFALRWYYMWPTHKQVIHTLHQQAARNSCTVDSLEGVSSCWTRRSRVKFMQHYRAHSFLAPKALETEQVEAIAKATEQRIAVLLGLQPAPEYRHVLAKTKTLKSSGSAASLNSRAAAKVATNDWAVPHDQSPPIKVPASQIARDFIVSARMAAPMAKPRGVVESI